MESNNQIPHGLDEHLGQDSALGDVASGLAGDNKGIKLSSDKLSELLGDTTRGLYILLAADSGCGKTTFADHYFAWAAYGAQLGGYPVSIVYQSWEISKVLKRAKLMSYVVKSQYNYRISAKRIVGRDPEPLTDDELIKIKECAPLVDRFFENNHFSDQSQSPEEFERSLHDYASANGDFVLEHGKITGYVPREVKKLHLFFIDHIALCDTDKGQSMKQAIDAISKTIVKYRNMCNFTFVVVQQFNTDLQSSNRNGTTTESSIAPQRVDFGDSRYTYRDADTVVALVKPAMFDLSSYLNYDLDIWGSNLIGAYVMKNRYGVADKAIPLRPDFKVGTFSELPPAQEFRINNQLYNEYLITD